MSQTSDESLPPDEEDASAEHLPLTDLESMPVRPPSWRKRGLQVALVVCALGVALVALWNSILPDKRQPTPGPAGTAVQALLVSNLTYATITLNGKKITGKLPQVVSAYLEANELTIAAPRFRPFTCHFKGLLAKEEQRLLPPGAKFMQPAGMTTSRLTRCRKHDIIARDAAELAAR